MIKYSKVRIFKFIDFNLSIKIPREEKAPRGNLVHGCFLLRRAFLFAQGTSTALPALADRYRPRRDLFRKAPVMLDKQERRLKFQQQLLNLHSRDHVNKIHRLVP